MRGRHLRLTLRGPARGPFLFVAFHCVPLQFVHVATNNHGSKPDDVSPRRQSADDIFGTNFVGLCEFPKEELHQRDTILIQIRNIGWYVEDEDGVRIEPDGTHVFMILEDTFENLKDPTDLTPKDTAEIADRIERFMQSKFDRELATLQFRVVTRKKRTTPDDVRQN